MHCAYLCSSGERDEFGKIPHASNRRGSSRRHLHSRVRSQKPSHSSTTNADSARTSSSCGEHTALLRYCLRYCRAVRISMLLTIDVHCGSSLARALGHSVGPHHIPRRYTTLGYHPSETICDLRYQLLVLKSKLLDSVYSLSLEPAAMATG
jgi:hypothetical protein